MPFLNLLIYLPEVSWAKRKILRKADEFEENQDKNFCFFEFFPGY